MRRAYDMGAKSWGAPLYRGPASYPLRGILFEQWSLGYERRPQVSAAVLGLPGRDPEEGASARRVLTQFESAIIRKSPL